MAFNQPISTLVAGGVMAAAISLSGTLADAAVQSFSFAQISDTHMAVGQAKYDANLQAAVAEFNGMSPRPAFVINTGDITEMGAEAQFALYKNNISKALMPFKNTPGNHETRWADMSINRFAEMLGEPNISFKYGGVRFIGWNSAIWLEHHGAISGDTRRWIVSQLKLDPPGTPAVLFTHQPPMYPDSVYQTGDVELWEAIRPYNVRMFLNGHGHIFKNWTVNGIFCRMTKGMMNEQGGYSLFELDSKEIRVYDKLVGGEKKLSATVPLTAEPVKIEMAPIRSAVHISRYFATVTSGNTKIDRVEYLVNHHQRPADRNWKRLEAGSNGRYMVTQDMSELEPGRHTLAVRAVDADGGVWIKTVDLPPFQRPGVSGRVLNAGTALQGPAVVGSDAVFVGGWDGKLYAVDRKTLKTRWTFKTGRAVIGRPDLDARAVYFGSTDQNVYAVDRRTGKQIWRFSTQGPIQAHALVQDGTVYIASGDRSLYAIDAKTGKKKWAYQMGMHAQARPAYAKGILYIGAWDNMFYAIDARTGVPVWTHRVGPSIFFSPAVSSPLVVNGKVITSAAIVPSDKDAPNILCLDAATGERLWGHHLETGTAAYSTPTTDGKSVFMATLDGGLMALDLKDGMVRWRGSLGEAAYDCSPVYTNGKIICNTLSGGVKGVDAATGKTLWSYKTGTGFTFAWPAVDGRTVYQPSMDGTLTEIRY